MKILVLGAGAMGTALAGILSGQNEVALWARRPEQRAELKNTRENKTYLPGYKIPENVEIIENIDYHRAELVLLAIPTQHLRTISRELKLVDFHGPVLNTAKGLELGSMMTPCEILLDLGLEDKTLFAFSGPTHAEEVCQNIPTSIVLAGTEHSNPNAFIHDIKGPAFRPYLCYDRIGVELGGALKNIIAIACGISEGLGYGMNTTAAIITRGISEIKRYGLHRGAKVDTFHGLSCLGDLVTTCCSPHSRNRSFGISLVKNADMEWKKLAEGAHTVKSLVSSLESLNFDMPLSRAVYEIAWEKRDPLKVMQGLISRPVKEED